MSAIKLITDAAELAKTGKELVNHIKDTDSRIAIYLLSEIAHIEEHRNPTRLNQFFSRIRGSGARVNAMHNFVQVFGNVTFNKDANSAIKSDGKKNENNKFAREVDGEVFAWFYTVNKARKIIMVSSLVDDAAKLFKQETTVLRKKGWTFEQHLELAQSKPWWNFQPERAPVAFNAEDKIKGALKAVWRAVIEDGLVMTKETQEALNTMTQAAFTAGILKEAKDAIPESLVAKVPEEYKTILHVNDNSPESEKGAPGTVTEEPRQRRARG